MLFEVFNEQDPEQVACLKELYQDASVKQFIDRFRAASSFTELLEEIRMLPFTYLMKKNGVYVGWFEVWEKDEGELATEQLVYAIVKQYRNQGLAKEFLTRYISESYADVLILEIEPENDASNHVAESMGFSMRISEEGLNEYYLQVEKEKIY